MNQLAGFAVRKVIETGFSTTTNYIICAGVGVLAGAGAKSLHDKYYAKKKTPSK